MSFFCKLTLILTACALLAGCAGDLAFKNGEKYAVEGDWDRAVAYYRQALQQDPQNISYITRLTKALQEAAIFHAERASMYLKDKNPDVAIAEAKLAKEYSPDYHKADQLIEEAGKLKEAQAHYAAGVNYFGAGRPNEALDEFNRVLNLEPDNKDAQAFIERITKQKAQVEEEDSLQLASEQPITLSFKDAKLKEVFEFLSKLSGISILFDEDVKDQPVTVFAKDVTFTQALKLLLATNKLFMKKIAPDAIIIIPKTKSKLDQYQDLMIKTFYLSHIKAKDMVNILRTMLETRKVIINDTLNSVTLRETPDKLKLAEKLIESNDRQDSEVVIDVTVMAVDRGPNSMKYGLTTPTSITASYIPGLGPNVSPTPPISSVLTTLPVFNHGNPKLNPADRGLTSWSSAKNDIWVQYVPSITADFLKSTSKAETLTNPQIRALNNQPAKILIGSRIPVTTGQSIGTVGTAVTTFEYRDVGIKLTVVPDIGLSNDVQLKATLEVSSLGGNITIGGQSQPTFNTTTAETTLSLKDGETVIVGGLLENVTSQAATGIIGVMDVPILGKLFSSNTIGPDAKREIVMTLTPHIVRPQQLPSSQAAAFWSGTEESYDTKPLFEERKKKLSAPEPEVPEGQAAPAEGARPSGPAAGQPGQPGQPPTPAPAPTPRKIGRVGVLSFAPETVPVQVGQEVTVDVMATDMDSVFEAPVSIIYNPKLLDFVSAQEGDFMKVDGKPTSFTAKANAKVGYIDVFLTRLGHVPGISGTGRLFSLTFKATHAGISPLVFKQNLLKDADKQPVPADLKTGTIFVQ